MSKKRTARPRKLKIGDNKYEVKTRKYKSWSEKGKTRTFGQIQYDKSLIEVADDQSGDRTFSKEEIARIDTVIHEILHGIIHEYKIGVDGRKEEKWVSLIANGLTDVFLKNPKLVSWIKERIEKELAI